VDAGQGGLAEQLGRHRALEADVEVAVGLQAPEQVSGQADEVLGRRRGQRRPDLVPGERAADDVLAGQVDRHGVNGRGPGRRPCRDVQPRRGSGELGGADDRNRRAGPEQAAIVRLLQVAGGEAGRLATGQLAPEAPAGARRSRRSGPYRPPGAPPGARPVRRCRVVRTVAAQTAGKLLGNRLASAPARSMPEGPVAC
jgi:hypothetical protein